MEALMQALMQLPWFWIWLVLAAALAVGEMLTMSFFLLPFAIGAAASCIASAFGASLAVQWLLFVVVSVVALIALRPLAKRLTRGDVEKSGVDRLIGNVGEVIEGGAPAGEFRVRVNREVWNAVSRDGLVPEVGRRVAVDGIDGTHLVVRMV